MQCFVLENLQLGFLDSELSYEGLQTAHQALKTARHSGIVAM